MLLWRLRNAHVVELVGVAVQELPGGGKAGLLLMVSSGAHMLGLAAAL